MKVKTNTLTGAALDWAVAKADNNLYPKGDVRLLDCNVFTITSGDYENPDLWQRYAPTIDWAQGGPLVEREGINTSVNYEEDDAFGEVMHRVGWKASSWNNSIPGTSGFFVWAYGDTALIAAMRCLCSAKLGDEVEIPEELLL